MTDARAPAALLLPLNPDSSDFELRGDSAFGALDLDEEGLTLMAYLARRRPDKTDLKIVGERLTCYRWPVDRGARVLPGTPGHGIHRALVTGWVRERLPLVARNALEDFEFLIGTPLGFVGWRDPDGDPALEVRVENVGQTVSVPFRPGNLLVARLYHAGPEDVDGLFKALARTDPPLALGVLTAGVRAAGAEPALSGVREVAGEISREAIVPLLCADDEELRQRALAFLGQRAGAEPMAGGLR